MLNIVCSWWGEYYGPEYVNKLYGQVKRNCSADFRFFVQTDNPNDKLDPKIETIPIGKYKPEQIEGDGNIWKVKYRKVWDRPKSNYWEPKFMDGLTIALDLDVVILKDLTELLDEYDGKPLCLRSWWHDHEHRYWHKQNLGAKINGGCFIWEDCENTRRIWRDLEENWDMISFVYKTGDNFLTWRHFDEFKLMPPKYSYSFNRGRKFPEDMEIRTKQEGVLCLFNTDNGHGHIELHEAYEKYDWIKDHWHI